MNADATSFSALIPYGSITSGSGSLTIILWIMLLGLLTLSGFIQQIGTFGRWLAPYTLLITLSLIMVLGTGWLTVLYDRLILSGRT